MRVNKTISVDASLWELFVDLCKSRGSKASWEIDALIERELDNDIKSDYGEKEVH